ncbi:hypothetical protein [Flavihumibacter petaseus]|uniref:Uncharacterized protein n=1 Tax=Flavihumibacter petaseus NBRC 106054 TaxID=1220578 RepID=A0A0E9N7P4_9BACT|nr:hypothetical protein [Flavihumibacter petaseus]GAO45360.1 hypothetical protein FPE01S_05_00570 [Flavihumibacter petaseus NBRC 106054]
MSKEDIKQEIYRELDSFSENTLQDVLTYLRNLRPQEHISLFSGDHLNKLLSEDRELLQRLAQ